MRLVGCSIVGALFFSGAAQAQVNLPPPPPPPLGSENPPPPSSGSGSTRRPKPREAKPSTSGASASSDADRDEEPTYTRRTNKSFSLRANPLPIFLSRLSVDAEWMFLPRHAVVVSPHLTFQQERSNLPASAFGFTNPQSNGVGFEIGYHHYFTGYSEPEGLFLGPSLLVDSTRPIPNAARFTSFGVAFDAGYQVIVGSGFTMQAGGGVLAIGTSGQPLKLSPRVLLGIGWTF